MKEVGWLLLLHRLPTERSSERVTLWRKLKKLGVLPLDTGGHLLPDRPDLRERMQWLAEQIREAKGDAALAFTDRIEGLTRERIVTLFQQLRASDYEELATDLRALRAKIVPRSAEEIAAAHAGESGHLAVALERCRVRFAETEKIDYFQSPAGGGVKSLLMETESLLREPTDSSSVPPLLQPADYRGRRWLTRPRPEIDRVGSAWLIRRYVDPQASILFADPAEHPDAIPFDLPGVEFSHHGDDCTFETLLRRFGIKDATLVRLSEMVHDADLEDDKFARPEALGLDRALKGWALLGVEDDELLRRGSEGFDALHAWLETLGPKTP